MRSRKINIPSQMVTAYLAAACESDDGVDAEQSHLLETRGAALMMQLTGILPTTTTGSCSSSSSPFPRLCSPSRSSQESDLASK